MFKSKLSLLQQKVQKPQHFPQHLKLRNVCKSQATSDWWRLFTHTLLLLLWNDHNDGVIYFVTHLMNRCDVYLFCVSLWHDVETIAIHWNNSTLGYLGWTWGYSQNLLQATLSVNKLNVKCRFQCNSMHQWLVHHVA